MAYIEWVYEVSMYQKKRKLRQEIIYRHRFMYTWNRTKNVRGPSFSWLNLVIPSIRFLSLFRFVSFFFFICFDIYLGDPIYQSVIQSDMINDILSAFDSATGQMTANLLFHFSFLIPSASSCAPHELVHLIDFSNYFTNEMKRNGIS